jgi:hypothetical protein
LNFYEKTDGALNKDNANFRGSLSSINRCSQDWKSGSRHEQKPTQTTDMRLLGSRLASIKEPVPLELDKIEIS